MANAADPATNCRRFITRTSPPTATCEHTASGLYLADLLDVWMMLQVLKKIDCHRRL
jgi:hypothetical protein